MSMIRKQEELRMRAAELRARASQRQALDPAASRESDEAAKLDREADALQPHVDEQRAAIRAVHGGPLAVLAHAAAEAARAAPTAPFVGVPSAEEQRQRMNDALSGVRHTSDDARRHAEAREREEERLRRG